MFHHISIGEIVLTLDIDIVSLKLARLVWPTAYTRDSCECLNKFKESATASQNFRGVLGNRRNLGALKAVVVAEEASAAGRVLQRCLQLPECIYCSWMSAERRKHLRAGSLAEVVGMCDSGGACVASCAPLTKCAQSLQWARSAQPVPWPLAFPSPVKFESSTARHGSRLQHLALLSARRRPSDVALVEALP